jgi:phenylpropionate dioxygenase-like ring-hydroxylating dioxygenase large terminal subunit
VTVLTEPIRTVIDQFRATGQHLEVALTPPPESYTSEEFFAFEQSALFAREWICVCREEDISRPGDFRTTEIAGEPIIVVRGRDGEINAMSAVCRHRGACITAPEARSLDDLDKPLEDTNGNVKSFKCPYHWWVYDLDGQLVGAPEMSRTPEFAVKDIRLPRFKTEVWHGFVMVNLDPDAKPFAPQVAQVDEAMTTYSLSELVSASPDDVENVPFNWKILVENFLDAYHASRLHAGLHDFAPSANVEEVPFKEDSAVAWGWSYNTHIDAGFTPTQKILMPVIPGLPENYRRASFFGAFMPNLLIIGQADMLIAFVIRPTSARSHALRLYYLVPPTTTQLPNFQELLDKSKEGFIPITEQDMGTNISVQKGVQSRFFERGRYSWQESMVNSFNRLLYRRYAAAAE